MLRDLKSSTVITHMKSVMARFGIVDELITDNGTQFTSEEFKTFAQLYEFKHTTSSPTYPRSNGMAEKGVQIAKRLITKANESKTDPYLTLLAYRNTPRDDIGSPAQRLMSRRAKTRLPETNTLRKPSVINPAKVKQHHQQSRNTNKYYHDR